MDLPLNRTQLMMNYTITHYIADPGINHISVVLEGRFEGDPLHEVVKVVIADEDILNSSLTTVLLPVIYIIIFIVGLPTNFMAIWVFLFRTKKKHPASILMVNLALADLLFIIWLPLKISYHFNGNNWSFGEPLCKVLVGFFYGNMYCSTLFIACISVQRYWAIVHPLSQQHNNNCAAVCVSVCVWVFVWLLTMPLYLYDQTIEVYEPSVTTCHDVADPNQSHFLIIYFVTMGIVGYVFPCIVCTVAYVLMFRFLKSNTFDKRANKSKKKALILMITVLIMFLVSFTPSNLLMLVHYSLEAADIQNYIYKYYILLLSLSSLNSCMDPFVYYFISEEFREHVKNTLICRSERTADSMKVCAGLTNSSTASRAEGQEA